MGFLCCLGSYVAATLIPSVSDRRLLRSARKEFESPQHMTPDSIVNRLLSVVRSRTDKSLFIIPSSGLSRDMGPVGRCSGLPGLRQAFPGPGGADPGYVEHRPVSGAGVRKLVAARCAPFRKFAPLRLARPTPARTVQAAIFGKCAATFRVLPDDSIYVCPETSTRHDPPRLAARHIESQRTAQPG